eukprot:Nitzschia sp. Nitz4//scaffold76_size158648//125853//127004//NITZ4_002564-RA/size158648-processed-gene-0.271-mRNA-1//-1//CDS//3329557899//7594//frame0
MTRSGSSLVGPPVTVADGDSVGENTFPTRNDLEYKAGDVNVSQDLSSHAPPEFFSPPVDHVISTFNDELDNLTKAFDDILSHKRSTTPRGVETSSLPSTYSSYKRSAPRIYDPPPSATAGQPSPSRTQFGRSTPARQSHFHAEPPPTPVQTPGFGFPTPNRRRRPTPPASVASRSYPSQRAPLEPLDDNYLRESDISIQRLRSLVSEQERTIQDLELNNEMLRRKMLYQPPSVERLHQAPPEPPTYPMDTALRMSSSEAPRNDYPPAPYPMSRPSPSRHDVSPGYREEPAGRRSASYPSRPDSFMSPPPTNPVYPSSDSRRRTPRTTPSLAEIIEEEREAFSPGTRFVAQLAALMKVEEGHHVPLSYILDKHWDKLRHHFVSD